MGAPDETPARYLTSLLAAPMAPRERVATTHDERGTPLAMNPYIGITGFMSPEEIRQFPRQYAALPGHALMLGVLVSQKTMDGEPPGNPRRYPPLREIGEILLGARHFFPHPPLSLVHFNSRTFDLVGQIARLLLRLGSVCNGVQLNVVWPQPDVIAELRDTAPRHEIVMQIGPVALENVEYDPEAVARRVAEWYEGKIDAVLVDLSGGRGLPFDLERGAPIVRALRRACPTLPIGVAGGLCAETLPALAPLLDEFPDLSLDAEGRLRDDQDNLDLVKSVAYLDEAARLVTGHRRPKP